MKTAHFLIILMALVGTTVAQETRTWTGQWNNKKFGTSGKLNCVTTVKPDGQWEGRFTGVFRGEPFDYTAVFAAKDGRQGMAFSGDATVRGSQYRWTGSLRGNQLRGQYTSQVGYYGEFLLIESGVARSSGARPTRGRSTRSPAAEPRLSGPLIKDGERMLFVGNSFMANEGGVDAYLAKALEKDRLTIETEKMTYYGKPLKEMLIPEVGKALSSNQFDSVVVTSGDIESMKHFEQRAKSTGKKTFIFMTWELSHPGNRATEAEYTAATRQVVQQMRRMEKESTAVIVPSAVVFHDLTLRPPSGMPRVDYLWFPQNIHQNELGTLVNAWMLYAVMTGKSPVGVNFDMPPYIDGQTLQKTPEIRLTRDLRTALQERVWDVAQRWRQGETHLD